ncbi:MAG: LPS ABC transporter substrate-binding protein LptA [Pseudolabrys sp.]|nr:LPS ABC transporter substrate-binding protein LptA [Pseudolabrys sp.]MBV9260656.1 LPS ABC transporter substrate-binding protein LptA [Pseudolabrys sp.]
MKCWLAGTAVALVATFSPALAAPKGAAGPPNAVQGFSQNRDQPVHIEAAKLEVRDKDKVATFTGNVQVIQGDTEMRCRTLVVFYEQDAAKPGNTVQAATPGPGGEQRIKRLEAKGNVVVTQNDQVATGDQAVFEMASNTVTMTGKVVVTQGQNVLRGDRLVVDMTTGTSRVESGDKGEGRVQGLFLPGSGPAPAVTTPGRPNTIAPPAVNNAQPRPSPSPSRIY